MQRALFSSQASAIEDETADSDQVTVAYRRRWWTLLVLLASLLMIVLDNTIINVALPTLQRELGAWAGFPGSLAQTSQQLIVARAAMGVGGALVMPLCWVSVQQPLLVQRSPALALSWCGS